MTDPLRLWPLVYPAGRSAHALGMDGDRVLVWEHGCVPDWVPLASLHEPPEWAPEEVVRVWGEPVQLPVYCDVCREPEDTHGCTPGDCRAPWEDGDTPAYCPDCGTRHEPTCDEARQESLW